MYTVELCLESGNLRTPNLNKRQTEDLVDIYIQVFGDELHSDALYVWSDDYSDDLTGLFVVFEEDNSAFDNSGEDNATDKG